MEAPHAGFASLPLFLALDIFARLPADARLLLALVSPSWRTNHIRCGPDDSL